MRPNSSRQAAIQRSWDRANALANAAAADGLPDRPGRTDHGWGEAMDRVKSTAR